jgi:hypothetical protein
MGIINKSEKVTIPSKKMAFYLRKNTKDLETFEEVFLANIYDTPLPFEPKTIARSEGKAVRVIDNRKK